MIGDFPSFLSLSSRTIKFHLSVVVGLKFLTIRCIIIVTRIAVCSFQIPSLFLLVSLYLLLQFFSSLIFLSFLTTYHSVTTSPGFHTNPVSPAHFIVTQTANSQSTATQRIRQYQILIHTHCKKHKIPISIA